MRCVAAALVACISAPALPSAAGPRDRLERIDQHRERVEDRLERVHEGGARLAGRIAALDRERAAVEAALLEVDDKIAALDATILRLEGRLDVAQHRIATLSKRIAVIEARLRQREALFHDRAVSAYKSGSTGGFTTLLSATSLSDLVDRFTYFVSALDADAELLSEIKALEEEVARRRAEVERRTQRLAADKEALQETRSRVAQVRDRKADALAERQAAIARKEALLASVRTQQGKLRDVQAQLQSESDRIEALLAIGAGGTFVPGEGGELAWPAAGAVTSGFGYRVHPIFGDRRMHTGVDIASPHGAPVYAAAGGVVAYVGTLSGYGNVVAVDHGGGLATTYNHLSAYYVSAGERVRRGGHIAAVGCTGFCTGPHLHFEVRINGTPVDPLLYLR